MLILFIYFLFAQHPRARGRDLGPCPWSSPEGTLQCRESQSPPAPGRQEPVVDLCLVRRTLWTHQCTTPQGSLLGSLPSQGGAAAPHAKEATAWQTVQGNKGMSYTATPVCWHVEWAVIWHKLINTNQ